MDAIIAQGREAGGHRGIFLSQDLTTQVGTFALLPRIVRAVNVPVIAAGGIADAEGVAAAPTLGAAGAQVGAAYLLCPEVTLSAADRAALQSPAAQHTAVTAVVTGRPARAIVNRFVRELGPISARTPEFPLALAGAAALRTEAEARGSHDFTALWSGQNASGCRARPSGRGDALQIPSGTRAPCDRPKGRRRPEQARGASRWHAAGLEIIPLLGVNPSGPCLT